MSLTQIRFNFTASVTKSLVDRTGKQNHKSLLALSSGKRINSLEDDASGFHLARGFEASRRSLEQAINNVGNAGNMLNMASSSYSSIYEMLISMREWVLQGADDSYNTVQRASIQGMIDALETEIDEVVGEATFQGNVLIDGTFTGKKIQASAVAGQAFDISLAAADVTTLGVDSIDVLTGDNARASMATLDNAMLVLERAMQSAGEALIRLRSKEDNLRVRMNAAEAGRSRIEDADFAKEKLKHTKTQIMHELGFVSLKNAIAAPRQVLSLFA